MYKIFYNNTRKFIDSYRHYTTNSIEQLTKKIEGLRINFIITTLILKKISIYIRLTGFLETNVSKIMFNIESKILERLMFVKRIYIKLIFGKYVGLN